MTDLLSNLYFLVFSFLTITSVVGTIAAAWHKVRKAELEASLKHAMIERGMSAQEIKEVVQASLGAGSKGTCS